MLLMWMTKAKAAESMMFERFGVLVMLRMLAKSSGQLCCSGVLVKFSDVPFELSGVISGELVISKGVRHNYLK